mmetsp:Transcript_58384/g.115918  ORF Transcript_58384/g.115918 Transcript_58384/m.115918 type:complete len:202 (+) Transcript_58384:2444-3049(+)
MFLPFTRGFCRDDTVSATLSNASALFFSRTDTSIKLDRASTPESSDANISRITKSSLVKDPSRLRACRTATTSVLLPPPPPSSPSILARAEPGFARLRAACRSTSAICRPSFTGTERMLRVWKPVFSSIDLLKRVSVWALETISARPDSATEPAMPEDRGMVTTLRTRTTEPSSPTDAPVERTFSFSFSPAIVCRLACTSI